MATASTDASTPRKPLRLWPGVVLVAVQWLARFGVPVIVPAFMPYGVMTSLGCALLLVVWWLFFSRARWLDRLGALVVVGVAVFVASRLVHESIATGAMGMLFPILAVPVLSLAFVASAVATRHLADGPRRVAMVVTIFAACGVWTLLRTGGFTSNLENELAWRWTPTPEEQLLARAGDVPDPAAVDAQPARAEASVWPGFRGPVRDGIVTGLRIATDWGATPPQELWRRSVGPGWSSFAVSGDLVFTQEQRGDDEVVAAYLLATGEPVWRHSDAARFWESNAGAGPRGTPTVADGHVYAFGATGIVNALDATDGSLVWTRNAASDTGTETPTWGFSSSPLVNGDLVFVAVSGTLAAYDRATGAPRWTVPTGAKGQSYSSPHLATLDGVAQILLLTPAGVISVASADGGELWQHAWKGFPIVQPALTEDGDVLISVTADSGTRRLEVHQGPDGWSAEERWTSIRLKPYFSDFVVHRGHAYGFDGSILACIELETGERRWKGGRYGNGQLVLLADQDVLLVLTERGELALVGATPEGFVELARQPAIEGKTWNHPVLAGDVLLARNDREMVAYRLARMAG